MPYVPCGLKRSQGHWLALCTDAQLWFDKIFSPLNCVIYLWSRLFLKVLHNGKLLWHGVKNCDISIWQKICWSWIRSGEELWEWIFREIVQCGGEIIGKTMRSSPQVKIEKTLAFQQVGLIVYIKFTKEFSYFESLPLFLKIHNKTTCIYHVRLVHVPKYCIKGHEQVLHGKCMLFNVFNAH